jgi:hypothetical protein
MTSLSRDEDAQALVFLRLENFFNPMGTSSETNRAARLVKTSEDDSELTDNTRPGIETGACT